MTSPSLSGIADVLEGRARPLFAVVLADSWPLAVVTDGPFDAANIWEAEREVYRTHCIEWMRFPEVAGWLDYVGWRVVPLTDDLSKQYAEVSE